MAKPSAQDPIRVLIVDDSAIIRGFTARALNAIDEVNVVGSVPDGQAAVFFSSRDVADIIVLDIEMPVMDGLTAIPHLRKAMPWARIIMSSTLTQHGAEVTLRAMDLGAADYVTKPTSTREADAAAEWKQELVAKILALGAAGWQERQSRGAAVVAPRSAPPPITTSVAQPTTRLAASSTLAATSREKLSEASTIKVPPSPAVAAIRGKLYDGEVVTLRSEPSAFRPEVIAIGSSTGGPQALFTVIPHLKGLRQPIVITQHMPKTFTTILADHITKQSGVPCEEAKSGLVLQAGKIVLAAGDNHLLFVRQGNDVVVQLDQGPAENFCRPAVDPMLRSLISIYGASKILSCILTGMGSDGLRGNELVVTGGGLLVGQDQASSVVWGMPGAVATAGLCSAVLPLNEIGPHLRRKAGAV